MKQGKHSKRQPGSMFNEMENLIRKTRASDASLRMIETEIKVHHALVQYKKEKSIN